MYENACLKFLTLPLGLLLLPFPSMHLVMARIAQADEI